MTMPAAVREAFEKGNAQPLIDWFNAGADGAITWCSPGDFDDCVDEAGKHMDNPQGFCNERHQDVCGGPPGSEDHGTRTRVALAMNAESAHYRLADVDGTNCHTCEYVVLHGDDSATCSKLVDPLDQPLAVDPQHVCDLYERQESLARRDSAFSWDEFDAAREHAGRASEHAQTATREAYNLHDHANKTGDEHDKAMAADAHAKAAEAHADAAEANAHAAEEGDKIGAPTGVLKDTAISHASSAADHADAAGRVGGDDATRAKADAARERAAGIADPLKKAPPVAVGQETQAHARGGTMPITGEATLDFGRGTRDQLLAEWHENPVYASALRANYEVVTAAARARLGEEPYWTFISQDERDKAASSGAAMPDGSYPITACEGDNSVDTAINAVGRGGADHDAIRRHIMTRAKSLNCSSKIPDNWNSDGSLQASQAAELYADANPQAEGGNGTPFEPAPYRADPDETVECPSCHKMNDQDASYCDQCGTKLAGNSEVTTEPKAPEAPPAAAAQQAGAFADAPPPADTPPAAAPAAVHVDAPDTAVDAALAAIDQAIAAAEDAERKDMTEDGETDSEILTGLEKVKADMLAVHSSQKADEKAESSKPTPAAPDMAPAPATAAALADLTPGNAEGIPGDGDDSPAGRGDIANGIPCDNPNCGHMSDLHADTPDGKNVGACSDPNCTCPGMVSAEETGQTTTGTDNNAAAPPGPGAVSAEVAATQNVAPFADAPAADAGDAAPPEPTPAAPASGDKLPAPNPIPDVPMGPAFTIPVGIIEGMATGDKRAIVEGALEWDSPPLPLMGLFTATHDPNGFDMNDPADIIGRIDSISRRPDDNGVIMATGYLLSTEAGMEAAQVIEQMGRVGVSADVGSAEVDSVLDGLLPELPPEDIVLDVAVEPDGDEGASAAPLPGVLETLTKGTILGFTVCPHAAFSECFIVLGDGSDLPPITELVNREAANMAAAPDTEPDADDAEPMMASSNWRIAMPEACEPCATGVVVASAGVPIAPPKSWFDNPGFHVGDARLRETVDDRTGRLTGKYACPPTIDENGRVYMHLAQWGVCHTGPQYKGKCMLPPRNFSGYSHWYGGGQIRTAEGELLDVGPITIGTGHAALNAGMGDAISHYDHTGTAVAYGTVGEDDFGIWFAGVLSPDATPEQVFKLRASVPSGDWRPRGSRNELVACLMVNRGGFPQARAHSVNGRQTALVAAGAPAFEVEVEELPPVELTVEERLARIESTTAPLLPLARSAVRERFAALRG